MVLIYRFDDLSDFDRFKTNLVAYLTSVGRYKKPVYGMLDASTMKFDVKDKSVSICFDKNNRTVIKRVLADSTVDFVPNIEVDLLENNNVALRRFCKLVLEDSMSVEDSCLN